STDTDTNSTAPVPATCDPLPVDKAPLIITTQIHHPTLRSFPTRRSSDLNSVVHDTATVTGAVTGFAPTGTLSFRFFTTIDCTGTRASPAASVEAGFYVRWADSAELVPGVYSYDASIATDTNYTAAGPAWC